jgi:hypothetical protein
MEFRLMASAIFVVPLRGDGPDIPITELSDGYSCIGNVPSAPGAKTCMVRVWLSDEQLVAMKANPRYFWVEDVTNGQS